MTAPRQILPGSTYLITRRCSQRQLLLKPSATTNAVFRYVLAVAARCHGIRVHAYCVMSNHFHLVVTDPKCRLPAFAQHLGSLVARALNASYGRWESFWAPGSYSAVRLETPDDVLEKAAYTLANPVAAGLVRRGEEWPGLWSAPARVGGKAEKAKRPEAFFNPKGQMPEEAELELVAPKGFGSAEEFKRKLRTRVDELAELAAKELRSEGRTFMGASKVLAQRPTDRPRGGEPRGKLNPRVAAADKWKRLEALGRLKEFVRAYREALTRLWSGARNVVFPPGTYLLRITLGVRCAKAG
jgi:REP element-mobilizing transposase RayT